MRKLWTVLTALVLALLLTAGAWAEPEPIDLQAEPEPAVFDPETAGSSALWECTAVYTEEEGILEVLDGASLLSVYRNGDRYLLNASGKTLLDGQSFYYISCDNFGYVKLTAKDGRVGLASPEGSAVIPVAYDAVEIVSAREQLGLLFRKAAEGEAYDYQNYFNGAKYVVSQADVYFDGAKILSLAEDGYCGRFVRNDRNFGRYFCIYEKNGTAVWYDSTGEKTGVTSDTAWEYDDTVHVPTGIEAFTAGCPLTAADVETALHYDEENGTVLDLNGNTVLSFDKDELEEALDFYSVYFAENGVWVNGIERLVFCDWSGEKVLDLFTEEEESLYEEASDGTRYVFTTDTQIAFADTAAGTVTWCELPDGYETYNIKSAEYVVLYNEEDDDELLVTAAGVIDLGDYEMRDAIKNMLIVRNRETDELYLIDPYGNIILEGCKGVAADGSFCVKEDQICRIGRIG